jgi:hypothetical protein
MTNAHTILVRKLKGKKALGKPKRWWENDIKTEDDPLMDLWEVGCEDGGDWIQLLRIGVGGWLL